MFITHYGQTTSFSTVIWTTGSNVQMDYTGKGIELNRESTAKIKKKKSICTLLLTNSQ